MIHLSNYLSIQKFTESTMKKSYWERRRFFEVYSPVPNAQAGNEQTNKAPYACPCCGFPTLGSLGGFEICSLCCWEDDGHQAGRRKLTSLLTFFRSFLRLHWSSSEIKPKKLHWRVVEVFKLLFPVPPHPDRLSQLKLCLFRCAFASELNCRQADQ